MHLFDSRWYGEIQVSLLVRDRVIVVGGFQGDRTLGQHDGTRAGGFCLISESEEILRFIFFTFKWKIF